MDPCTRTRPINEDDVNCGNFYTAAANFLSLLESFDLQRHVRSCTHRGGHTLDLVITRAAEYILNAISVDDSSEISDHYTVCADLRFVKPNWERKRICGRKLKAINLEHFRQDVAMSPLLSESSNDLLTLLHLYNSELSSVLEKHCAIKIAHGYHTSRCSMV